jgi:hypothetical protein
MLYSLIICLVILIAYLGLKVFDLEESLLKLRARVRRLETGSR